VLWWNFSTARCQFFAAPSGKTIQRFFPFNPLTSRKKDAKNCIAGDLTRSAHLHGINKPVYASVLFCSRQKTCVMLSELRRFYLFLWLHFQGKL